MRASSFRMGRRPRVTGRRLDAETAEGEHNGFLPLGLHRRRVTHAAGSLRWTDGLEGPEDCPVTVRLGLAPDARVTVAPGSARIEFPGGPRLALTAPPDGTLAVEEGLQCERFGASRKRPVLVWRGVGGRSRRHPFSIEPAS